MKPISFAIHVVRDVIIRRVGASLLAPLATCTVLQFAGCTLAPAPKHAEMPEFLREAPTAAYRLNEEKAIVLRGRRIDEIESNFGIERIIGKNLSVRGLLTLSNATDETASFGVFQGIYHHLDFRTVDNHVVPGSWDPFRQIVTLRGHENTLIPFEVDLLRLRKFTNGTYFFRFTYDIRLKRHATNSESLIQPWSDWVLFEVQL